MSWFPALLWLISGLVGGSLGIVYLIAWSIYHHPIRRLEFFRVFAQRWPDEFERALHDAQIMGADEDEDDDTLEPIQFGVCSHCQLPWPIDGGKLIEHPSIKSRHQTTFAPTFSSCEGSNSENYYVAE